MAMNRVVIPLDGSHFSRLILPQVQRFLDPTHNELILLHVSTRLRGMIGTPPQPAVDYWPTPIHYLSHYDTERTKHPIYESQFEDNAIITLQNEFVDEIQELEDAGYLVSLVIKFGDPAQKILEFLEAEKVDLVAMATHGRTGMAKLMFGNVADEILRKATVPVLLLPPLKQATPVAERETVQENFN